MFVWRNKEDQNWALATAQLASHRLLKILKKIIEFIENFLVAFFSNFYLIIVYIFFFNCIQVKGSQENWEDQASGLSRETDAGSNRGCSSELRHSQPSMANTISNMKMTNPIKGLVSKRRKRFTEDGFDLDLSCKFCIFLKNVWRPFFVLYIAFFFDIFLTNIRYESIKKFTRSICVVYLKF